MSNLKINWDAIHNRFKKADCHVNGYHAHKYVNPDGLVRYLPIENLSYQGYRRCDEYLTLYEDQKDIVDFLVRNRLLEIQDNIDLIRREQETNKDYIEYRYKYEDTLLLPMIIGKTTMLIPQTTEEYAWTRNPNHYGLTGRTRTRHFIYTSYKIEVDERGRLTLVENPEDQDIISTMDEYPFIKEDFCKAITIRDSYDLEEEQEQTKRR